MEARNRIGEMTNVSGLFVGPGTHLKAACSSNRVTLPILEVLNEIRGHASHQHLSSEHTAFILVGTAAEDQKMP